MGKRRATSSRTRGLHGPWRSEAVAGDRLDVRATRDLHHDVEIVTQIFEHALNAQVAAQREAIEDRPSAGDDISTQRQCAEHVRAAADAAVEDNWHSALYRIRDARQHADGCGNAIK